MYGESAIRELIEMFGLSFDDVVFLDRKIKGGCLICSRPAADCLKTFNFVPPYLE
jgi:hypothetical protein